MKMRLFTIAMLRADNENYSAHEEMGDCEVYGQELQEVKERAIDFLNQNKEHNFRLLVTTQSYSKPNPEYNGFIGNNDLYNIYTYAKESAPNKSFDECVEIIKNISYLAR